MACLLQNKPLEEPVSQKIYLSIKETADGAFEGSIDDQIHTARAALSVFEYNTDRTILKRLTLWIHFLEIEFDKLSLVGTFLYQPADLMEFLVRFYWITGSKSALRLCSRLRASSFDWVTALHTFQQSIPIHSDTEFVINSSVKPSELDYYEKEKMINHAEMLADGVRYALYAGLFSGHRQDLTSGKTIWTYLLKHHHALCGGTNANPFLNGNRADLEISNKNIAAWTEAFASQLFLPDSDWALDELIRIVFNGLDDCVNHSSIPDVQLINAVSVPSASYSDSVLLYARILRAVSAAYHHAVSITEKGIRINYLIPLRWIFLAEKQPVILLMNEQSAIFQCKNPFVSDIHFYHCLYNTANVSVVRKDNNTLNSIKYENSSHSCWLHSHGQWNDHDGFELEQSGHIFCEETHHQGVCFISSNRLLSINTDNKQYAFAVCELPFTQEQKHLIRMQPVHTWRMNISQPDDIPVLPPTYNNSIIREMSPYSQTPYRITMFPRTHDLCLK